MKLFQLLITISLLTSFSAVHATEMRGCAAKVKSIQTQLKYAHSHGDTYAIKGLKKALKENIQNCNETKLKFEREQKVLKKQKKVEKIEAELKEYKDANNHQEILKKERN